MALNKVTYVDNVTVIGAENLNAIQDAIIENTDSIGTLSDLTTESKTDLVSAINEAAESGGSGVPTNVRQAMLTLFESAAYAETGLTDEIAVIESWAAEVTALSLSADTLSLNEDTPQTLVATVVPSSAMVTWSSSDATIATVVGGVVTGVSNGNCTITASAGDISATCAVTVSGFAVLESISAVYTQSGTVYTGDSLDSLKADLAVTANYSDSTTEVVTNYVLSGTLTAGTSTINVSYGGKTTTFTVTVTYGEDLAGTFFTGTSFSAIEATGQLQYDHNTSSANRLGFASETGTYSVTIHGTGTAITCYPIPVPQDATKMIFSFNDANGTPDTSVAMNNYFVKWDSTLSNWFRTEDRITYTYGSGEHDIVAADNDGTLYAVFTFRNTANDSAINSVDRSHWVLAWR